MKGMKVKQIGMILNVKMCGLIVNETTENVKFRCSIWRTGVWTWFPATVCIEFHWTKQNLIGSECHNSTYDSWNGNRWMKRVHHNTHASLNTNINLADVCTKDRYFHHMGTNRQNYSSNWYLWFQCITHAFRLH